MDVELVRARTKFSHEFALPRVVSNELKYLALIDAYTKTGSATKSPERIFVCALANSDELSTSSPLTSKELQTARDIIACPLSEKPAASSTNLANSPKLRLVESSRSQNSNESTDCPDDEFAAADALPSLWRTTRSTFAGCDVGDDVSAESITILTIFGNISSLYAAPSIFALTGIFPDVSLSLISYAPSASLTALNLQLVLVPTAEISDTLILDLTASRYADTCFISSSLRERSQVMTSATAQSERSRSQQPPFGA